MLTMLSLYAASDHRAPRRLPSPPDDGDAQVLIVCARPCARLWLSSQSINATSARCHHIAVCLRLSILPAFFNHSWPTFAHDTQTYSSSSQLPAGFRSLLPRTDAALRCSF